MLVEDRLHEIFWGAGLEKQTFKMTGPAATAANLVWRGKAMSMLAANFFMVALLVVLGALLFKVSLLKAVLLFIDAFVAFPVFFELTDLPERPDCQDHRFRGSLHRGFQVRHHN